MKNNSKRERALFAGAAVLFVVLVVVMVFLLLSGRGTGGDAAASPTAEPTATAEPGSVTIGGKSVAPDADTFYLNNVTMTAGDKTALAGLRSVTTLSLTGCGLTDVSFLSGMTELTTLYLSSNSISDLAPLASLQKLRTLYLDNNPVTDFSPLTGLQTLTTLSLKGISLADYVLEDLRAAMPGCNIFDDSSVDAARPLSLGGLDFTADDTELNLSNRGIADITKLAYCEKLEVLDLSGNPLESVATLMELPALRVLHLDNTGLDDADLNVLIGIRHLETLTLTGNSELTAEKLDELAEALPDCAITHDEVFYKLKLGGQTVTSDAVSLSLAGLNITDISGLKKFDRLETVDLSGNSISDLAGLRAASHLRELNLENNRIVKLDGLENHTELTTLDLSGNQIADVTVLATCTGLKRLDLSNNALTYISHLALCSQLEWLDLRGNPAVTADMVEYLRLILPTCEIVTDLPAPTPTPTIPPLPTATPGAVQNPDPTAPTG